MKNQEKQCCNNTINKGNFKKNTLSNHTILIIPFF